MEPLSVASGIAGILGGVATVASKIHTLKQRYQHSELNLTLTSSMLFSVKRALESIQEMRDGSRDTSKASQQLDKDLSVPLESCAVLIAMIERGIEGIDIENPSRTEKWKFVSLNETFTQAERSLDSQVRALSLLLQIYQCGTLAEQTERLRRRDTRAILDRVRLDTASAIQMLEDREGSDAASILSSEPSVKFMFDDDLLQHPMYQRVYPHLWRRKNLRDRDSLTLASPRQSIAVPPSAHPPPVPRKDVPTDNVQTPTTTTSSGLETIQATRAPPVPPKPDSPQKIEGRSPNPDGIAPSPTSSTLLSPKSAERKAKKKKKGSRSVRNDPLLGVIPDIPFLGTPFQGEQPVELSESSESEPDLEPEDEVVAQPPGTPAVDFEEGPKKNVTEQNAAAAPAKEVPEEGITTDLAQASASEDLPGHSTPLITEITSRKDPDHEVETQLTVALIDEDAGSDLYGVSDDEYEPPATASIGSGGRYASQDQISHDIPTINEPKDDSEPPLTTDSQDTSQEELSDESPEPAAIQDESIKAGNNHTDIDRIVSHIRNHRARAASDAASATSLRGSSHGRSVSDTSGVNHIKLEIESNSRPVSRGTSTSAQSTQHSQDTQEHATEAFSPTLPSLESNFGSFEVNFDPKPPNSKVALIASSSASSLEKAAPAQRLKSLPQAPLLRPAATESQEEPSTLEKAPSTPSSPSKEPQTPVRAPPPPPVMQPSPTRETASNDRPPPIHAPPPPPAPPAPSTSTRAVPTPGVLSSPPVLPPARSSPSPSPSSERRLSPTVKLNPPALPPRPTSQPVSQPPLAVQNLSPQPSPLLRQSQIQEPRSSTLGLLTDIMPTVALRKAPPPPPPPRLSKPPLHQKTTSTSHANSITEQTETPVIKSPRRASPPIPAKVAPLSPASTPSARTSPRIPPKPHSEVQEEVHTPTSPLAETIPPVRVLTPQRSPPSLASPTLEIMQQVVSDDDSTVGSTVTGSRNSGSFWDTRSMSSTHHTTINSGWPTIVSGSDGLPLDRADDTPEQAERRQIISTLGQQGQKDRSKKLLPKSSTARLSSLFSSKDKTAKLKSMHEAARDGRAVALEEILRGLPKSISSFESLDPQESAKTMLMRAAEGDHVECLQLLARHGADVGQLGPRGQIALHHAIQHTSINATLWLAQNAGSPPQMTTIELGDEHGFRALHLAAAKGNLQIMHILIQQGAQIDSRDKYGRSPLFTATIGSNIPAIDMLLAHGASLSQTDNKGRTPLMWAVEYDCPKVVKLFRERDADRQARDLEGNSVFHVAARKGLLNMIDALYLSKSDLEVANNLGERPLHLAAEADKTSVVKALVSIGCDPNVFTNPKPGAAARRKIGKKGTYKDIGATPLHYACANAAYDPASALVENGAAVNANQEDGTSPLMLAAEATSAPLVGLLLQFGANVEAKTSADHLTVLHIAAAAGDVETVKLLANNGAPVRALSKKNETPWQYATRNGSKNNAATSWLSSFTRKQTLASQGPRSQHSARVGPHGVAYPHRPSVPSVMYADTFHPGSNYTATGYLPNHTSFYRPRHVEASPRTDEGIDPPPAYTPRAT